VVGEAPYADDYLGEDMVVLKKSSETDEPISIRSRRSPIPGVVQPPSVKIITASRGASYPISVHLVVVGLEGGSNSPSTYMDTITQPPRGVAGNLEKSKDNELKTKVVSI